MKNGIVLESVIVFVIPLLTPVSFTTLKKNEHHFKTYLSCSVIPVRGGSLGPEIFVDYIFYYRLHPSCLLFSTPSLFPEMNARMSSFVTLPPLPEEATLLMSTPCFFAMLLTAGVANAF